MKKLFLLLILICSQALASSVPPHLNNKEVNIEVWVQKNGCMRGIIDGEKVEKYFYWVERLRLVKNGLTGTVEKVIYTRNLKNMYYSNWPSADAADEFDPPVSTTYTLEALGPEALEEVVEDFFDSIEYRKDGYWRKGTEKYFDVYSNFLPADDDPYLEKNMYSYSGSRTKSKVPTCRMSAYFYRDIIIFQ